MSTKYSYKDAGVDINLEADGVKALIHQLLRCFPAGPSPHVPQDLPPVHRRRPICFCIDGTYHAFPNRLERFS